MNGMERITGLRITAAASPEQIRVSGELSRKIMERLIKQYSFTYNQILYPYADALSLSGAEGTESTRIFGTHMLLRNVAPEEIKDVMQQCFTEEKSQMQPIDSEIVTFSLTEGAVSSTEIAGFLSEEKAIDLMWVGDFSKMLSGWLPHWRIRECARVYASFSEMSYRRAKGEIVGLYGGRLILTDRCDCREALSEIFTQKTGVG